MGHLRRARCARALAGAAAAFFLIGCSDGSSSSNNGATAAAPSSAAAAPLTSGAPVAAPPPLVAGQPLPPPLRAEVARAFAPELRFNAYHDDGNSSPQNRNEDYFPMGVASFLDELAAGAARVVVLESLRDAPAVSEVRPFSSQPSFGATHLDGFPRYMVGDAPGTAPFYVHLYEEPARRALDPDGSGVIVVHIEYWFFYAYDRAEALVFGFLPTPGSLDFTGHRGDWEHVSFAVRVQLDPGGAFRDGELEGGTFYGHSGAVAVDGHELERVDDTGRDDPAGRHPVVYIAQGKHASYPEAGHWKDHTIPSWLGRHTDFFRGNGVRIAGWRVPLPDLEDVAADPQEFASPAFQALVALSPGPVAARLPDWTEYWGNWGPDLTIVNNAALAIRIGLSPTGPKAKPKYGEFGGLGTYPRWADVKQQNPGLTVYKDHGVTIPRVVPPPAPIRR